MEISGMNSTYRFFTLEYFFKAMNDLEINNIELWTAPHHFFVDYQGYNDKDLKRLKTMINKYKVNVQCICPEQTNPKIGNLAVLDLEAHNRMISYFKYQINLAKELEASKVLITAGWGYLDKDKSNAWTQSVQSMKELCAYGKKLGVKIIIEALQPDESNLVNNISDLNNYLIEVDSDNLKICIDFGAMARSEENLKDYFQAFGEDIEHIHFVDGKPTGHLALGDGDRNLEKDIKDLKQFGYENYLTLETVNSKYYMHPKKADQQSINVYRKIRKGIESND